jgi:uncharacterized protein (TIGR00251 family)
MSELPVQTVLAVKAVPGSSRDEVAGWLGDALKVKVRAPALDGRANAAVCDLLARHLGVPRRAVELKQGDTSRLKRFVISGLDAAALRARVAAGGVSGRA